MPAEIEEVVVNTDLFDIKHLSPNAVDNLFGCITRGYELFGCLSRFVRHGQSASINGLRNIMTGDQCMTVYKRIKLEAQTAANIAAQLVKGTKPTIGGSITDPETNRDVPFASLAPLPITAAEVKDVVSDGFISAAQLCAGYYQELCKQHQVIP